MTAPTEYQPAPVEAWCPHFQRPAGLASGNCTCVTLCFQADQEARRAGLVGPIPSP